MSQMRFAAARGYAFVKRHKAGAALAVLLLIYGTLVFGVLPRPVFFSGDEGEKLVVAASVARSGDLWNVAYEYPGRDFDPEIRLFFCPWMKVAKSDPVPYHLSTLTFLNAPLYALLGVDGMYLLPLLSGIGVAWLAYLLARLMELPGAWAIPLVVGVCTPMFFYSLTTWDHAPTVLYSTLAVYWMARQARRLRWWEMGLAGIVTGLGMWTRYEMYLFAGAVVLAYVYVFRLDRRAWKGLVPFAIGLALVVALMEAQIRTVYGGTNVLDLWLTRFVGEQGGQEAALVADVLRGVLLRRAETVLALTVDGSSVWLERVFLALAFVGTIVVNRSRKLQRRPLLVMGSALMQAIGTVLALVHMRIGTLVGLVPTLPLSALGLVYTSPPATVRPPSRRIVLDLLATASVIYLLLGMFLLPAWGSLGWGPRYLAQLFPLLAMLAWATLWRSLAAQRDADSRKAIYLAFGALFVLSLIMQCVGVGLLYDKKQRMLSMYDTTRALDADYLLSEQTWYLQEMASLYFEKRFFHLRSQEEYDTVMERFYRHGVRRFAWVPSQVSAIEPILETGAFAVRPIDELLYEIVSVD
ncbi:MAG: glycosyltransferase family 39 protein [Anaerolineae bacterium]|nr:glycosyltransferase family 39 protein [Anaerolineae bacterium]